MNFGVSGAGGYLIEDELYVYKKKLFSSEWVPYIFRLDYNGIIVQSTHDGKVKRHIDLNKVARNVIFGENAFRFYDRPKLDEWNDQNLFMLIPLYSGTLWVAFPDYYKLNAWGSVISRYAHSIRHAPISYPYRDESKASSNALAVFDLFLALSALVLALAG